MSLFTLKSSPSISQSSSSIFAYSSQINQQLCLCPSSVNFPKRKPAFNRRRLTFRAQSDDLSQSNNNDNQNNSSNSSDSKSPNGSLPKNRRDILLEYVKTVQPEFMELFVKRAPKQVVDAMRQTVTNMIGTLPPQFFAVTVTTVAENLAQLMYSVLMTGYMFRNAQYRLELQQSLEQVALPDTQEKRDVPDFAPGTQKKVTGEVIRWNNVSGPEKIDAVKYIELLEGYHCIRFNHSSAGEDVVVAMNTFVKAVSDPGQMKTSVTETSAAELGKLLYWLMVVGYSLRNIEVRFDMERVLGSPPKLAELPPGENI